MFCTWKEVIPSSSTSWGLMGWNSSSAERDLGAVSWLGASGVSQQERWPGASWAAPVRVQSVTQEIWLFHSTYKATPGIL